MSKINQDTDYQRCWVHKTVHVLNKQSVQPKVKTERHDILMTKTRNEAHKAFVGEHEAELEAAQQEQDIMAAKPPSLAKKATKRKPLPDHLTRIERSIDLDDEQKAALGDSLVLFGHEIAEQLSVIPRLDYVVVTKRAKNAPANGQVARR